MSSKGVLVVPGAGIGTKSMQNTSAYEEPRSSGKQLHEYIMENGLRHTSVPVHANIQSITYIICVFY